MSDDLEQTPQEALEVIDADAVCAQCGTVNREGVFICRSCGNNLRDQRALRMIAEQEMDRGGEVLSHRRSLSIALTILGILAIVWTMLNVNTITDWLITAHLPSLASAEDLWNDPLLNEMSEELESKDFDEKALEDALDAPGTGTETEGYFVLADESIRGKHPVGVVLLRKEGEDLRYVAQFGLDGEVRGYATVRENQIVAEADSSAAQVNGRSFAIFGVAVAQEDGGYECVGQSELDTDTHSVLAYRMPN